MTINQTGSSWGCLSQLDVVVMVRLDLVLRQSRLMIATWGMRFSKDSSSVSLHVVSNPSLPWFVLLTHWIADGSRKTLGRCEQLWHFCPNTSCRHTNMQSFDILEMIYIYIITYIINIYNYIYIYCVYTYITIYNIYIVRISMWFI
jgi:hypothetical protein